MANPQKENGYTAIANEIVDHLCLLQLSGYESRVLWAIFRKTYGYQKREDIISLSQLNKLTKIKSQHLCSITSKLKTRNVIIITRINNKQNVYSIQKDYEKWVVNTTDGVNNMEKKNNIQGIQLPESGLPELGLPELGLPELGLPMPDLGTPEIGNKTLLKSGDTKENIQKKITKENIYNIIPTWIFDENWKAFVEMRKKKKAPLTEYAIKLICKKLEQFKNNGENPNDILDQSILNSWTDVYTLKKYKNNKGNNSNSLKVQSTYSDDELKRIEEIERLS
jgi:phage replication O-like protein O